VEFQEESHQNGCHNVQTVTYLNYEGSDEFFFIILLNVEVVDVYLPLDGHEEVVPKTDGHEVAGNEHVDQQQDKELSVPKAHAIIYPRTMVVHIENASVAS